MLPETSSLSISGLMVAAPPGRGVAATSCGQGIAPLPCLTLPATPPPALPILWRAILALAPRPLPAFRLPLPARAGCRVSISRCLSITGRRELARLAPRHVLRGGTAEHGRLPLNVTQLPHLHTGGILLCLSSLISWWISGGGGMDVPSVPLSALPVPPPFCLPRPTAYRALYHRLTAAYSTSPPHAPVSAWADILCIPKQ